MFNRLSVACTFVCLLGGLYARARKFQRYLAGTRVLVLIVKSARTLCIRALICNWPKKGHSEFRGGRNEKFSRNHQNRSFRNFSWSAPALQNLRLHHSDCKHDGEHCRTWPFESAINGSPSIIQYTSIDSKSLDDVS